MSLYIKSTKITLSLLINAFSYVVYESCGFVVHLITTDTVVIIILPAIVRLNSLISWCHYRLFFLYLILKISLR